MDPLYPLYFFFAQKDYQQSSPEPKETMLHGVRARRNRPRITHLFFKNDSLLFIKANQRESERVRHFLKIYGKSSGQKINYEKSGLFFSKNTGTAKKDGAKNIFGIQITTKILRSIWGYLQ